ncbi:MAG: DUF2480 family protein [candidate division Zixibacteria bacterium]
MKILEMTQFLDSGIITESGFFDRLEKFDWESYRDERVLVKGCGTTAIPPWAFMAVASRLAEIAKIIKYGNEHSSIPVFRQRRGETRHVNS